jgi:hypothetical protein
MAKSKKNPWIAAILNLLFIGLGYIYADKRKNFGIGLVIWGVIISYLYLIGTPNVLFELDALAMGLLFAYDGYMVTKEK